MLIIRSFCLAVLAKMNLCKIILLELFGHFFVLSRWFVCPFSSESVGLVYICGGCRFLFRIGLDLELFKNYFGHVFFAALTTDSCFRFLAFRHFAIQILWYDFFLILFCRLNFFNPSAIACGDKLFIVSFWHISVLLVCGKCDPFVFFLYHASKYVSTTNLYTSLWSTNKYVKHSPINIEMFRKIALNLAQKCERCIAHWTSLLRCINRTKPNWFATNFTRSQTRGTYY